MSRDLLITVNDDRSLTVSETSIEGKRLTYIIPAADAHDWLVKNGARCEREPRLVEVETDDLSDDTRREVEAIAALSALAVDRAEIKRLNERWSVLLEQKELILLDDRDLALRNDRLEAIDAEMREVRSRSVILEALLDIAAMEEALDNDGGTT